MFYFLFLFLLLLNIGYLIIVCIKKSLSHSGIEISHYLLFCLGLFFYWILPVLVGVLNLFKSQALMNNWHKIFDQIALINMIYYLIFTLLFQVAFHLGDVTFYKYKNKLTGIIPIKYLWNPDLETTKITLNIFYFIGFIPLAYFLYVFADDFFLSYRSEDSLSSIKGSFVALSLIYLAMAFIYTLIRQDFLQDVKTHKILSNKFNITYLIIALLILSLGGRLYFITSVFMFLVFRSVYIKKLSKKFIGVFLIGTCLLMGVIGVVRLGSNISGIEPIVFNIFAEPIYTSFSLISFIGVEKQAFLHFPSIFLSEFLNFIPSFIFPNKVNYFVTPSDQGYTIYSPLGALNSYVSFIINFGTAGSLIAIFLLSFILNFLKYMGMSIIYFRVIYVMVSGWLVFSFFRDPFSVSIIKNIIEFSILIPLFFIISTYFTGKFRKMKRG